MPHCAHYGIDNPETQAAFRAMKAEGGWAAVNTEYCSIHPESDDKPHLAAQLWDDADIRNQALLAARAHEHGALAGVELWYGSVHAPNYDSRLPARGVSQISTDYGTGQSCYAMDASEIRELQGFYVAAARRAEEAGFDIVNVYGGHCHTVTHHFLDPFYNKRDDEYGGSLANRARFWLEVLEMIRDAVGGSCAIAARIGVDTNREPGVPLEEARQFIAWADDLVDLWDVTISNVIDWHHDVTPARMYAENYQRPWLEGMRDATKKPVVGVGRFVSPDVMAEAVHGGVLDVIGAARPSIADPFLPSKIEQGRSDDIRECIGINTCLQRVWSVGSRLVCAQNATAGEEYRRGWHPERSRPATNAAQEAVVIGAGPAGLECAKILGRRGMRRVRLVDSDPEMGGHMRWLPQLPRLSQWAKLVEYRAGQIEKLDNVEFVLGAELDADGAADLGAQIVIVATGSYWATDGLNHHSHEPVPGADAELAHVLTPEQVMVDGVEPTGDRVLIYDCDGYVVAPGLAERLARAGKQVQVVTPFESPFPRTRQTGEAMYIRRLLQQLGVEVALEHTVEAIGSDGVVQGRSTWDTAADAEWSADGVVLVTQRVSNDALWRQLVERREELSDGGVTGLYRIGDCVAPRDLADVVFDGRRLAEEIDSNDPAVALPYRRENRVVGATQADPIATG